MLRRMLIGFLLLPAFAFSQGTGFGGGAWEKLYGFASDSADIASGKSLFQVQKPDILIQVERHRLGADIFDITAITPKYPPELLQKQVNELCTLLKVPARALSVVRYNIGNDPKLTYTRATFATDGVIDRAHGVLRVSPILQAFAGAPEPYTVRGISVIFNNEKPTATTLRNFSSPSVRVQAIANQSPPMIEYRMQLLSQNPAELAVPDEVKAEQKEQPTASTPQQKGIDWTLWLPLLLAAVAASILIYFLLLRLSSKPRR